MTNKEINRESRRVFEGLLLPHWLFRPQEDQEDYGIDGEIEITTPQDQATGFIFKVQLKGTSRAKYDGSGNLIFSDASVKHFSYYLNHVRIPILFVVCDVQSNACFWSRVQGNRKLEKAHALALASTQDSFTLKLLKSQTLSKTDESADAIIEAVENASESITLRSIRSIPTDAVRGHFYHTLDAGQAEKQFRMLAGAAANEAIRLMIQAGDYKAAVIKSKELFEAENELLETRILGGVSWAHAVNLVGRKTGIPSAPSDGARFKLAIAFRMMRICRAKVGSTHLSRYVRIYLRASRMSVNARSAMALAFSERTQAKQGETLAGPLTQIQRLKVSSWVTRDFLRLRDSLFRLVTGRFYGVLPYAWSEVAESITPFLSALRTLGRNDLADAYLETLFDYIPFSVQAVGVLENEEEQSGVLTGLGTRIIGLADVSSSAVSSLLLDRFQKILESVTQITCCEDVMTRLRKIAHDITIVVAANKVPSFDELRSHFAQQAADLGIDLADPKDRMADIIRIGINDLDPTRVAQNCQHIHIVSTFRGIPAEMLGLPTAGGKRIFCLKHGHSIEGVELDVVYKHFSERFPWDQGAHCCVDCADRAPHPVGWSWTEAWQREQAEKHRQQKETLQESDDYDA